MAKPVAPPRKNSWTLEQRIGAAITGKPNPSWELIVESLNKLANSELQELISSGQLETLLSGSTGTGGSGANWFFGNGSPSDLTGAKPGDLYMDVVTGTVYKLEK